MQLDEFSQKIIDFVPLMLREFTRRSRGVESLSLTVPQMVALHCMADRQAVTMKELAAAMRTRGSSSTVLVDRLIAQGFARRKRDASDRRVVRVAITKKGKDRLKKCENIRRQIVKDLYGKLTKQEREDYIRILTKVAGEIKKFYE